MSKDGQQSPCPVFFCGAPQASPAFDAFLTNAQNVPAVKVTQVPGLPLAAVMTKDIEYGVVILLFATKNDLALVINALGMLKKRIDKGFVRAIVYNLVDQSKTKIPSMLKTKGCTEMLEDGLPQKGLIHKLQRHVQIAEGKFQAMRTNKTAVQESVVKVAAAANATAVKKGESGSTLEKGKIKFVPALTELADCWLVKNKRDFKYVRGNWIGEMIGPGPSAGAWIEAGGTKSQPVFRWTSRNKNQVDPFVGDKGSWFCAGRKPEFDWKSNRWRFIGETPSLFFKMNEGTTISFRFRSAVAGLIDIALNSAAAKSKLQAMIETFAEEKVFKDTKGKEKTPQEIKEEKEKKKAAGAYGDKLTDDAESADWGDKRTEDDEMAGWGELKEGEEEEEEEIEWNDRQEEGEKKDPAALNDRQGEGEKKGSPAFNNRPGEGEKKGPAAFKDRQGEGEKKDPAAFNDRQGEGEKKGPATLNDRQGEGEKNGPAALNDRQSEGEPEEESDWSGLDIGRGNKFNSGRGLGQGDSEGKKGYKYDKDGKKVEDDEESSKGLNDRTGEGEEEDAHDWSGLDVGRGNKFQSGGGLTQGQGGSKGYKYDKDGNPIEQVASEDDDGEDDSSLDDPFNLDVPLGKKSRRDSKDREKEETASGSDSDVDLDLDNLLGNPAEDTEWETGAAAFESITLDITVMRENVPDMGDVSLLERQGMDLLLDAPASSYQPGETFNFSIKLGEKGQKKNLQLAGILKSTEPVEGSRAIVLVTVDENSKIQLIEIQTVFDNRQAQLLKFLREAKG